jgi:hypothetical protein
MHVHTSTKYIRNGYPTIIAPKSLCRTIKWRCVKRTITSRFSWCLLICYVKNVITSWSIAFTPCSCSHHHMIFLKNRKTNKKSSLFWLPPKNNMVHFRAKSKSRKIVTFPNVFLLLHDMRSFCPLGGVSNAHSKLWFHSGELLLWTTCKHP